MEIGSKTAEKNSAQTNRQTNRHYENNGHLAVNQQGSCYVAATELPQLLSLNHKVTVRLLAALKLTEK